MVSNSGASSTIGTSNNISNFDGMVSYLDSQVDQGYSARVHVDRTTDGVGDHWVAISSRTTNLRTGATSAFGFFDPGTRHSDKGTHKSNVFRVASGKLSGTTNYNGKTYTVTAVRKNK